MDVELSVGESTRWEVVLAHRGNPDSIRAAQDRFIAHGVAPEVVRDALRDAGEQLYSDATSGKQDWAVAHGGLVPVALLSAEVAAFASHLVSRASNVRSLAVDTLLDDFSAVSVASELGISRQKIYEIGRAGSRFKKAISEP